MNKKDIVKVLEANDSTILSFSERGPWGDRKYRGNCSGYVQAFLIWRYKIQKIAELFAGSGTGYDVAKDMGIQYVGADLNPTPVRPGIIQVDAFWPLILPIRTSLLCAKSFMICMQASTRCASSTPAEIMPS